jgi:hypothetical protein
MSSLKTVDLLEHSKEHDFIYNQTKVKKEDYSFLKKLAEPKDVIMYEKGAQHLTYGVKRSQVTTFFISTK